MRLFSVVLHFPKAIDPEPGELGGVFDEYVLRSSLRRITGACGGR